MLEKILKAAKDRGISQLGLERYAALPQNRISKWKASQGEPSWKETVRLARVVGLPLDYLADDSLEQPGEILDSPQWVAIRQIVAELGEQEAIKRLLRPPGPVFDVPPLPTRENPPAPSARHEPKGRAG